MHINTNQKMAAPAGARRQGRGEEGGVSGASPEACGAARSPATAKRHIFFHRARPSGGTVAPCSYDFLRRTWRPNHNNPNHFPRGPFCLPTRAAGVENTVRSRAPPRPAASWVVPRAHVSLSPQGGTLGTRPRRAVINRQATALVLV